MREDIREDSNEKMSNGTNIKSVAVLKKENTEANANLDALMLFTTDDNFSFHSL